MKKALSFILCISLMISTFVFVPFTVSATGDYTLNFQSYATGAEATGWGFNLAQETKAIVTADKTIKLTASGTDPFFGTPDLNVAACKYDTVKVGLKWTGVSGGVVPQLFIWNDKITNWAAGDYQIGSTTNTNVSSASVVEFSFNVVTKAGWSGMIKKLRIDPADKLGTYELSYVTLVSNGKTVATFDPNGGTTTTPVSPIAVTSGTQITIPDSTYTKTGSDFIGWSDGTNTYQPGDSYTLTNDTAFTAVWHEDTTVPIMGQTWEFNGTTTENWGSGKINNFAVQNGCLIGESNIPADKPPFDPRISNQGLALDPTYCLLKFRYKVDTTVDLTGGCVYFTRTTDKAADGTLSIVSNGVRQLDYTVQSNKGFVEYTVDLSKHGAWNGTIWGLYMDPIRGPVGTSMQMDYIRLYRKGTSTVQYNANTTDTVTVMPVNDTQAAKGTGYMLSGQVPARSGYKFLGWSATADGTSGLISTVDVIQDTTTLYAQWQELVNTTASFNIGDAVGVAPGSIQAKQLSAITLPGVIGFSKDGYTFAGWSDGKSVYAAGSSYMLGLDAVTFTATWNKNVTVTFDAGLSDSGTAPQPVQTAETLTIALPANTLGRTGYTFAGWYDGTKLYSDGASYKVPAVGGSILMKPVWNMQTAPTFLPANGATNVDFRNLSVKITFPVDIAASTLTSANISSTWAQSVVYDSATKTATVYLRPDSLKYSTTVSFTTSTQIMSADYTESLPATAYSFTTLSTQPEDGSNLVSNGDFELPYISAYEYPAASLSTDTPTGTGHSLALTNCGPYAHAKFNIFVKPGSVYFVEYDLKVTGNKNGDTTVKTTCQYAQKVTDGSDRPLLAGAMQGLSDGWKHYSGYTNGTDMYKNIVTGNTYMFIYSNPINSIGMNFMIDNMSVREAYPITFAPGTVEGKTVTGSIANAYSVKGGTITLPKEGFACSGMIIKSWTDGTNSYDAGSTYTVPLGGANLTAVWEVSPQFTASFSGGTGATGTQDSLKQVAYETITLPQCTLTKEGYIFRCWTDGTKNYNPGDAYTMPASDVSFTAIWRSSTLIGLYCDFTKPSEAWSVVFGFSEIKAMNGYMHLVSTCKDARLGKKITDITNSDGKAMSSNYNMMKIRYKRLTPGCPAAVLFWQRVGDATGSDDVVSAFNGGRCTSVTYTKTTDDAADSDWAEATIDLSTNKNWNGDIRALYFDPLEGLATGGTIDIDYIKFYQKGSYTVSYSIDGYTNYEGVTAANAPSGEVNINSGTLDLTRQIPIAIPDSPSTVNPVFAGWVLDGQNTPVDTIEVTGDTTVYAIWEDAPAQATASFAPGDDNATGTVADITAVYSNGGAPVTLPTANAYVLPGKDLIGWYNGSTATYAPGETVNLQKDTAFTAVWAIHKNILSYDIGEGATKTGNLPTATYEPNTKVTALVKIEDYSIAKAGYYFAGWKFGNTKYESGSKLFVMPASDVTFTAVWLPNPAAVPGVPGTNLYGAPVTFEDGNINFISTGIVEIVADPTNANNHVLKYSKDGQYASLGINTTMESGRRYYVSGKAYVDPTATENGVIQVNFRFNDADHAKNMGFAKPGVWTSFSNYFDVPAGTGITGYFSHYTNPFTGVTGNGYIMYDDLSVISCYKITYDPNGGTLATTTDWSATAAYTPVTAVPTKDGFDFDGWSQDGTNKVTSLTLTGDTTLKALWKTHPMTYTLSFNANTTDPVDNMPGSLDKAAGTYTLADLQLLVPTRTGFIFKGWSLDGTTIVTSVTIPPNTELKAVWEAASTEIGLLGDANGDGSITAFDAVTILQIVAGLSTATSNQTILCNVNSDASGITAYDAVLVLQHVAGLTTGYNIGQKVTK